MIPFTMVNMKMDSETVKVGCIRMGYFMKAISNLILEMAKEGCLIVCIIVMMECG